MPQNTAQWLTYEPFRLDRYLIKYENNCFWLQLNDSTFLFATKRSLLYHQLPNKIHVLQQRLFLGAFANLRKATRISFMFVCPSICPHGTRLPMDGFWRNLVFETFLENLSIHSLKPDKKRVLYMTTFSHLWQYLADFFSKWEMFKIRFVEKIKTRILCSVTFFRKSCRLWHNVEKYGAARKDAHNMAPARGILDKQAYTRASTRPRTHTHVRTHAYACRRARVRAHTHTCNNYFPRQQWFHERDSMLISK